jgi:hypothetical protein
LRYVARVGEGMHQWFQGPCGIGRRLNVSYPVSVQDRGRYDDDGPGHHLREEHAGDGIDAHIADNPPVDAGTAVFAEQVRLSLLFRSTLSSHFVPAASLMVEGAPLLAGIVRDADFSTCAR